MKDFIFKSSLFFAVFALVIFSACSSEPTCTDGEQNQFETGIDCGGPCTACGVVVDTTTMPIDTTGTCSDGIMNQDETGVDCGGATCEACDVVIPATMSAEVNGVAWAAATVVVSEGLDGDLVINGIAADLSVISLVHTGEFAVGTYDLDMNLASTYTLDSQAFCTSTNGTTATITFTAFDTTERIVSGNFVFNCSETAGGEVTEILLGQFANATY